MKLVFATNNLNKLKEVQEILSDSIEVLSLKDIGCFEDVEETEATLEGNARLKADHITKNYGYHCFADDTGLEVDALDGKPGVYSARYGGEHGNSEKNMQKLLKELQGKATRKAQFRTAVALNLDHKQYLFEGICEGEILTEKTGTGGFGYDPIFIPKGYDKTFAQLGDIVKNNISHRAIATQYFLNKLNKLKKT